MTAHLPECLANDYGETYDCICDRLRACEQRVASQYVDGIELVSYRKGLDAAREAVLTYADETHKHFGDLFGQCREEYGDRCDITAALRVAAQKIDALREEQK